MILSHFWVKKPVVWIVNWSDFSVLQLPFWMVSNYSQTPEVNVPSLKLKWLLKKMGNFHLPAFNFPELNYECQIVSGREPCRRHGPWKFRHVMLTGPSWNGVVCGDPTPNKESFEWVYKPLLLCWWVNPLPQGAKGGGGCSLLKASINKPIWKTPEFAEDVHQFPCGTIAGNQSQEET